MFRWGGIGRRYGSGYYFSFVVLGGFLYDYSSRIRRLKCYFLFVVRLGLFLFYFCFKVLFIFCFEYV